MGVPPYPVSDTYRIRICRGYAGDTSPSRIGVLGCIGPRNSRLDTYLCVIRPSSPTPWEYPPLPCRIRPPHARRCTRLRREGWGRSCWGRRLREMVAVRGEECRPPPLPPPHGRARGGLPARVLRSIRRAPPRAGSDRRPAWGRSCRRAWRRSCRCCPRGRTLPEREGPAAGRERVGWETEREERMGERETGRPGGRGR